MTILVITAALVYLIGVIRAREPLTTILAVLGIVLWLLTLLGAVQVSFE